MPELRPPYQFGPERFAPGRAEREQQTLKAGMRQFVRRYRISIAPSYAMPAYQAPISKLRDGLPVRFEPL